MSTKGESVAGAILATILAIFAAVCLMNWAACEQDDSVCMFTGKDSK